MITTAELLYAYGQILLGLFDIPEMRGVGAMHVIFRILLWPAKVLFLLARLILSTLWWAVCTLVRAFIAVWSFLPKLTTFLCIAAYLREVFRHGGFRSTHRWMWGELKGAAVSLWQMLSSLVKGNWTYIGLGFAGLCVSTFLLGLLIKYATQRDNLSPTSYHASRRAARAACAYGDYSKFV